MQNRGVTVKFAIHPVAGRMPGHMNVLLAEAGVPYDIIADLEEINPEFPTADVALIIGANDVVNPDARNRKDSPIYGMPILDADKAKNVIVIKRGQGRGFSGIENALFYMDNTRMLYGDGQEAVAKLIQGIKDTGLNAISSTPIKTPLCGVFIVEASDWFGGAAAELLARHGSWRCSASCSSSAGASCCCLSGGSCWYFWIHVADVLLLVRRQFLEGLVALAHALALLGRELLPAL